MKDLGINKTYKIGIFLNAATSFGGTFQFNLAHSEEDICILQRQKRTASYL